MRRLIASLVLMVIVTGCGSLRLFGGGDDGRVVSARESAARALNMTTKTGVAMLALAGAAYRGGTWGPPGSPRAEAVRGRFEDSSKQMANGLTAWAEALDRGELTRPYEFVVQTALDVITGLLPQGTAALTSGPIVTDDNQMAYALSLSCPESFFTDRNAAVGGAR